MEYWKIQDSQSLNTLGFFVWICFKVTILLLSERKYMESLSLTTSIHITFWFQMRCNFWQDPLQSIMCQN